MKIANLKPVTVPVSNVGSALSMRSIPIKLFQEDQTDEAGAFVQSFRENGEISAAFIYTPLRSCLDEPMGALYIVFPEMYRVDVEKVEERYVMQSLIPGEQLCVWIMDRKIEEAVSYIVNQIEVAS